jgi:putative phosphoesterase
MRIGLISDTHGLLRPEVLDAFAHVDHILHAGDVGGEHVLDALRDLAPVIAVRGNVDVDGVGFAGRPPGSGGKKTSRLRPPTSEPRPPDRAGHDILRLTIADLKILMTHILPRPDAPSMEIKASLETDSADVVIFGHSHLPHDERVGGVWFLNPASAGPRRFDYPVSVAILERQQAEWIAYHVALDHRSVTAISDRMNQLR